MYKYGDREMHSYVYGVFTKKHHAIKEAEKEREDRGGNKYYPEILEFEDNSTIDNRNYKTIIELPK